MKLALENGFKDVTPDDIVPAVKEDWLAMRNGIFKGLDGESLANLLGKDVVSKINKAEIAKFKNSKFQALNPKQISNSNDQIIKHLEFDYWRLFGNCNL